MEGRVHKDLKDVFAQLPDLVIVEEQMAMIRQYFKENLIVAETTEAATVKKSKKWIPSSTNGPDIRIVLYENETVSTPLKPGFLWIHGGGYVMGLPEMDEDLCKRFASEAGCTVIAVDYRLAPEHPFPAPLDDCYDALSWFATHAKELHVNPEQIAIGGASAGGGLTAALSLLARDRGGPAIVYQMPLYPMIDDRHETTSSTEIQDTRVWNEKSNRAAWKMYLGNEAQDVSVYAAPARNKDFTGLPPTYTCVGDLDPFRDETIQYVASLTTAGVATEFHLYPGCFHGFEGYAPHTTIGQAETNQYIQALKQFFANKEAIQSI